jgi:hypothetical protein
VSSATPLHSLGFPNESSDTELCVALYCSIVIHDLSPFELLLYDEKGTNLQLFYCSFSLCPSHVESRMVMEMDVMANIRSKLIGLEAVMA